MSLSIRTLKIIIGITVLISMLLSMVPMFGMGAVGRSMSRFARQAPKGVTVAPVSAVSRTTVTRTPYIPQATKRPVGVPAYNVSPKETYEYGTLGVALPTFPQAPTPISVTVPELPKLPANALLPGSSLGVQNPVEFAPEIKPVEQPAVQEAEVKEAAQESKPEKGLFMKVLTQEIPKPETAPVVEEPVPTKPAPKHDLKIVLPKKSEPTIAPAEEIEILDDGTVKKFTEPQSVTEVTPVTSVVQTRAAEITQPTTEQAALTPASNHNEIEQRAEVVHAPVVGTVKPEEETLKPDVVIDAPFKIERVEVEAEPIFVEQVGTRAPAGELRSAVSAMPIIVSSEKTTATPIEIPEAADKADVSAQKITTETAKQEEIAKAPPLPSEPKPTEPPVVVPLRAPAMPTTPPPLLLELTPTKTKPEASEARKIDETKKADANSEVVTDAAPVGSSQAATISENADLAAAAATAATIAAPILGTAVTAEPLKGTVKIIPESASGLNRTVIVPDNSVVYGTSKTASSEHSIKRRPKPRTHIFTQHGSVKNELGKRGTTSDVLRDTKPEQLRRQVPYKQQSIEYPAERSIDRRRQGPPNRPAPLRPRPAVMLPAAPAVVPDSVYCPVIPPLNPENEPVVDTDGGSVRPLPMPVEPRPTNIPVVQPANNLPPARVQRRSVFDDLEDKVIRDKNAVYGHRFGKIRRGDSLVAQALPSLADLPSSLEQLAGEFITAYKQVNVDDESSYGEFINAYNEIMEAIRNEREKAQ